MMNTTGFWIKLAFTIVAMAIMEGAAFAPSRVTNRPSVTLQTDQPSPTIASLSAPAFISNKQRETHRNSVLFMADQQTESKKVRIAYMSDRPVKQEYYTKTTKILEA
jgi:hypothetical protein